MKLLKISLHGFKSFADKTTIDIKDGITGIVGPNGSGKSNIVDAIRWVLGEQSLKDIRGGNSSKDVIFSGSKSRGPLTRCWVSLTFDNSDHYLNSELTEIEIKRVVYITGENEYYINNDEVRLKDITNLFIDSGSSVNSLSIISQGKITEIVNGTPLEKRKIIEETAGVLKYKKRKEESLKKLDKTNDNLSKINLVIDELSINLEPLKNQAEVANKYLEYKSELTNTEIALLATDISSINSSIKNNKELKETLTNELNSLDNAKTIDNAKVDTLKHRLLKTEEDISVKSDNLFKLTKTLSDLNSEKQIMLERQKYQVDDIKLQNNIIYLKENALRLENNIKSSEKELTKLEEDKNKIAASLSKMESEYKNLIITKNLNVNNLTELNKEEEKLKNQIDILKDTIENDNRFPYPVRSVLNNTRLPGIHNALGKLIETEEKYGTAIDISLGYNASIVVVDNEICAKEAINYLKQNGLGRVTFYPLNIIKPRGIDPNTLSKITSVDGFIGSADSLVKYNGLYRNVVLNALGSTIIVRDLTSANYISKLINHTYRIVSLDGDLINPGGSITGGSLKTSSGIINQKFELENKLKLLKEKTNLIKLKEEEINDEDHNLKIMETQIFSLTSDFNESKEIIIRKQNELDNLKDDLTKVQNEMAGTSGLLENTIDQKIENILNEYYKVEAEKTNLENTLNDLKVSKNDLQSQINEIELANKKQNSEYNKKYNELKDLELAINKDEYKIDSYLIRLNEEYQMTYEKAQNYELNTSLDEARSKVSSLKRSIKNLGDVNTGAISEYDRIKTRFDFLSKQKEDLTTSINDLLTIINELDETMKDKLTKAFNDLNNEFKVVFKKLFRGGSAELLLTEPSDILNTGLEIKVAPPGKDIKNPKTLSGGESTLTAIALLFSILNIRTVPFCILDEVEAALDEANVDMFGRYLNELNTNTQFIIITHKKRTMEYTNTLYGITMQESGVSKLVSVKLD